MIQQTLNEDSQKKYNENKFFTDAIYYLWYFRPHGSAGDAISCVG